MWFEIQGHNSARPVGIGDVIRRVTLKIIDQYHRSKVIANCNLQMGNGITGGNEAIVHTLRDASEAMETNGYVILTIDASNAFNCIDRRLALETMHDKIPELYLTSLNTYGSPSYTVINGTKHPVEQGTSQGCPHAGSFFNVGLANLVDSITDEIMVKHM